jgi:hypothetical protein
MRTRLALLFVVSAPFALAGTIAACGGDDATSATNSGDGGAGNDGTTGSDGAGGDGTTGNDGSSGDGTMGNDGGTGSDGSSNDGSTGVDGGSPSNPGQVTCGTASCDIDAGQSCCVHIDGGSACVANMPGTCTGGLRKRCDEAADCPMGQICCYEIGGAGINTACATTCNTRPQACKTTSECKNDGGMCAVHQCQGMLSGFSIESCSGLPMACP